MHISLESAHNNTDVLNALQGVKQSGIMFKKRDKCQIINLSDGQVPVLQKGLKFMLLNIRSLVNKLDSLSHLLSKNKIDVLCLNETFCDDSVTDNELHMEGLTIERNDRTRSGGGVAIYIAHNLQYVRRKEFESPDLELICIQLRLPFQKDVLIFCVYRPPSSDNSFFEKLTVLMESVHCSSMDIDEILLFGDLNCNFLQNNTSLLSKLEFLLGSYSFKQLIDTPTRVTHNSSSLIDIICSTKCENIIEYGCVHSSLSDHYLVYAIRRSNQRKVNSKQLMKFQSKKQVINDEVLKKLQESSWSALDDVTDVNLYWNKWKEIFIDVLTIDKSATLKQVRVREKTFPWISADLKKIMRNRDLVHKKFLNAKKSNHQNEGNILHIWGNYKKLRNEVNSMMEKSKQNYFISKIHNCANDFKRMWNCLKILLPQKHSALPNSFEIDNVSCHDDKIISNAFNDFFIESVKYTDLHGENLSIHDKDELRNPIMCVPSFVFNFEEVTEDLTLDLLSKLDTNKSTGIDGISATHLKSAKNEIAPYITKLINMSFQSGVFPDEWKSSKICPLFKKGETSFICNYRPIAILPVVSKLIEKVAHKQLYTFLSMHNILCNSQFGFRAGHSTSAALGALTDDWLRFIDIGQIIGAIYVDLKRAFDTVDTRVMSTKLRRIGCSDMVISWFNSYLNNRKQRVAVRGTLSDEHSVSLGVPQGSILGPLLFLIYIDDLVQALKHCSVIMYADDTTLYVHSKSLQDIQSKLQEDMNSLKEWLCVNKLKLNTDKTKFMLIGTTKKLSCMSAEENITIEFDGDVIERCAQIKCLGVIIDEHLSWSYHVDYICKKVYGSLSMLRRVRPYVDTNTLKILYLCIVQSHLDYCCEIWGLRFHMHTERLLKLQKRAARLILKCSFYTPSKEMFHKLKWLPFNDRVTYFKCVFMYRCINGLSSQFYRNVFKFASNSHSFNTRYAKNDNLITPNVRTEIYKHSLYYSSILLWNSLPVEIKQSQSLSIFKRELKLHLFKSQRL